MDRIPHSLTYRPDIDGLRAIAVLSVVFYHAGLGFPGGYVGVDVFFVISGYLITALILKDLERGSFSMAHFWERRIRRIFPALAVMVAVTCLAGWFLLLPEDLAKLGASVIAQSLLVSNFYFWRTTNYFGGANEEKPLLHTWSLAVEEQFYLIFPIALMVIWAFFNYRLKKREERNLTTIEHGGRCEKEQPKVGPKGEGVGTSKSKDTENTERSAGLRSAGQVGAAFSNPYTSELARAFENTSLIRSADTPSSSDTSYSPPVTSSTGDQRRWTLFWILAAVALLSFGLSVWGVKAQPFATFFLLPTRAWELLLGSMLAVLPAAVIVRNFAQRDILCLAGLAGIFLPVFLYGEATSFPGLAALPPCLGTAALIWANSHSNGASKRGWIVMVLSWRPIVFIGLISYSFYLWHWPVLAYGEYLRLIPFCAGPRILVVLAIMLVSIVSWHFVEMPFRKMHKSALRWIFSTAAITSIFLICYGWFFIQSEGGLARFSGEALAAIENLKKSKASPENFHAMEPSPDAVRIKSGVIPRFGSLQKLAQVDLLVWGDSHAAAVAQPLHEEFIKRELSGEIVFNLSTPPIQSFDGHLRLGLPQAQRDEVAEAVFERIKEKGIRHVLLVGYWAEYQSLVGDSNLQQSLVKTIEGIQSRGATVWVALDWPNQKADPNRVLVVSRLPDFFPRIPANSLLEYQNASSGVLELRDKLPQVHFLDLAEPLLDSRSSTYPFIKDGHLVYHDANHLSPFALRTYFKNALRPLLTNLEESMSTSIHSWD